MKNWLTRGIVWLNNGKGGGLPGNTEAPLPTRLYNVKQLVSMDTTVPVVYGSYTLEYNCHIP